MKHILRPYRSLGFIALMGAWVAMAPPGVPAQATGIMQLLQEPSPMLLHSSSSQGYLGVDLADVDQDKAQALKLKEVRGAVITLIDHDAPAGQIGLKVNDVVIQLNGQNVEGAEQLRRMLRKVSLEISRDGNVQTLAVELADRKALGHDVWNKIGNGEDVFAQGSGMGILTGGGDGALPSVFRTPIFGSTLNVGALVEPLTGQMAEYLGVPSGLMVKQVARKSEAAAAGLKAFDVILKRSNQGKPVQVTILRDRKQQTLTLQVDSKHKQGELEFEEVFPASDGAVVAEIDPEFVQQFAWNDEAAAEALRDQADAMQLKISPEQVEALRRQAEVLRESLKGEDFQIDQKQLDQLKQQMEEFRKSFKPEDFKLDPKQMDELRQQMEQLQRQMEEIKALGFGSHV